MRIYFAGAHASGKSTIARYTASKYNLHFINEVARSVLAEKELNIDVLRTNLDVADDFQRSIFYRQVEEESKYPQGFVSDRTFDNLAYAGSHSRVLKELTDSDVFKNYIQTLKQKDVLIFFVRPSKETAKNDGVRETVSWDGIVSIDGMIKILFELFGIRYVPINTASMQERIRMVEHIVDMFLSKNQKW